MMNPPHLPGLTLSYTHGVLTITYGTLMPDMSIVGNYVLMTFDPNMTDEEIEALAPIVGKNILHGARATFREAARPEKG